ncbi:hypothetical protein [Ramlibacter sp. AN1133]|uniref:hypothetical protein n=1 Tax=Ramlibacter sp. AN1133 TaxID=3133429 RepID=UPI0030C32573
MNETELSRIAQLAQAGGAPRARALEPEVRSGASFTFDPVDPGPVAWPRFKVVWFFTVAPAQRASFALKVAAFESSAPALPAGVNYLGTYSVTISGVAPDFEYRMVWGLDNLAALQALNDLLHGAPALLRSCLDLISQLPAMRTEIMGRTVGSAKLTAG